MSRASPRKRSESGAFLPDLAGSDIAGIARAAGVPRSAMVRSRDEFTRAFDEALAAEELTTIVAKVEAAGPSAYVTDLALLENRFEFQRYLKDPGHKM